MNKMIRRAILTAGVVAALVLAYVGVTGVFLDYTNRQAVSRHLAIGLVGLLLLLLSHVWVGLYLICLRSGLLREAAAASLQQEAGARHAQHRRRVLPWLTTAVVFNAALFLSGTEVLTGLMPPRLHGLLWLLGMVCHVLAVVRTAEVLRDNDRLLVQIRDGAATMNSAPGVEA